MPERVKKTKKDKAKNDIIKKYAKLVEEGVFKIWKYTDYISIVSRAGQVYRLNYEDFEILQDVLTKDAEVEVDGRSKATQNTKNG